MIQPNELRIGNWMCDGLPDYPNEHSIFQVDHVTFKSMVEDDFVKKNIEGIPITEEWLERFGFEYERGFWVDENGKIFLNPQGLTDKEGFCVYAGELYYPLESKELRKIKYVHQLQNLYFALTGEELTSKP